FVPMSLDVIDRRIVEGLRERSFFLVAGSACGWQGLLDWTLRAQRGHVLMFRGRQEVPHAVSVRLKPFKAEALAAAVRPHPLTPIETDRIARTAARADGLPGRFLRLLGGTERHERPRAAGRTVMVAAETPATYGDGDLSPSVVEDESLDSRRANELYVASS